MSAKSVAKSALPKDSLELDLATFAVDYARKIGASYADARLESTAVNGFVLKNGVPQVSGFDIVQGIGIRIVMNNTLGFASTNNISREKVREAVEKAAKLTSAASRIGEKVKLSGAEAQVASYEVKQKVKLADLTPKDKLKVLFDAEKAMKATKVNVTGRFFSMSDFYTEKYFASSEGSRVLSRIPRTDFWYFVTVEEAGRTAQRYWQYGAAGGFEKITGSDFPGLLAAEVKATCNNIKKAVAAPKEKVDLVVAPQITGIMVHESVGHPYEADRVLGREAAQAGESFISAKMLGTRIGSPAVNIVDDPTVPGSFGYYLYDDEGVKARERWLIKEGIITELLHNRETAAILGTESNAASRATGYDREPIVRMANSIVKPGDYSEEELIESVKSGVFLRNFMEWNIDDKRLNAKYTGAEAYMIRNGRLAEPVWRPTIEISTPKLWSSVDAAAGNMEYHAGTCGKAEPMQAIPVWFGGPSMRIRNIRLSF
ncbi:TldD/PmbA family protein [Candidatus Woesearchaeota archaeon]|nr:TldD/PmbA family protein [Candidatus Woesearchaeota archaeon]